ncbi:hypothetical protein OY671_009824, partial [Metschnikowia pulcherrima]
MDRVSSMATSKGRSIRSSHPRPQETEWGFTSGVPQAKRWAATRTSPIVKDIDAQGPASPRLERHDALDHQRSMKVGMSGSGTWTRTVGIQREQPDGTEEAAYAAAPKIETASLVDHSAFAN